MLVRQQYRIHQPVFTVVLPRISLDMVLLPRLMRFVGCLSSGEMPRMLSERVTTARLKRPKLIVSLIVSLSLSFPHLSHRCLRLPRLTLVVGATNCELWLTCR